jgi:hypothetical protein
MRTAPALRRRASATGSRSEVIDLTGALQRSCAAPPAAMSAAFGFTDVVLEDAYV